MLARLKSAIIKTLFPPRCMLCGKVIAGEAYDFCEKCSAELPRTSGRAEYSIGRGENPRYVDLSAAPFFYSGRLRNSILRFKFNGKTGYAKAFARHMCESLRCALASAQNPEEYEPCYITWVPVSKKRQKKRGYDQSHLLAREIGGFLGLPVLGLIEKTQDNPPQSGLNSAQRKGNVLGVYEITQNPDITLKGKPALLIDDICTTGATVSEAAKTLLCLNPSKISALFIAKTENKNENAKKRLKMTKR